MEINQDYMVDFSNFFTSKYTNKKKDLPTRRKLGNLDQIIIHCTAAGTTVGKAKNNAWENPLTCISYDLGPNHISRSGLATATYHFYINQAGKCWQLVSMEMKTSHAGNQNGDSVAICINHDGETKEEITKELYDSLIETICYIFDKLDWGYDYHGVVERIHFHRDYSPKLCPGRLNKEQIIKDVAEKLKTYGDNE